MYIVHVLELLKINLKCENSVHTSSEFLFCNTIGLSSESDYLQFAPNKKNCIILRQETV